MVHLHNGILCSREKEGAYIPFVTAWMELESITLSEISQAVMDKFYQTFKEQRILILSEILPKIEEEEMLANSFAEASIILILKLDNEATKKEREKERERERGDL